MKIGFDAKRLFNNYTGLGNYSRTLVENIAQHNPEDEYYLYATHSNKNEETEQFYDKNKFNLFITTSLLKSFWRSFGILKQLKKDKIELYVGLTNELPFGIKNSGIKSIVVIHDLIFKIYPETYPFFDRLIYDFKFKNACKNSDKIIAISKQTKSDIIKFYNIPESKIEVAYQSCNPLFFTECNLEKGILAKYNIPEKYNLYVGTVNERKNLKAIIHAYNLLPINEIIPLVIIGNGKKYKAECEALINKLKLEKYFIWVTNLKQIEHLQLAYQNATCLIYPSYYEGFGIPIVEAMLSKIPVITSNVSCLPEVAGGNALLINPDVPQEIADSLLLIQSNEKNRNELINKGYTYCVDNYNAKITSERVHTICKETIQKQSLFL